MISDSVWTLSGSTTTGHSDNACVSSTFSGVTAVARASDSIWYAVDAAGPLVRQIRMNGERVWARAGGNINNCRACLIFASINADEFWTCQVKAVAGNGAGSANNAFAFALFNGPVGAVAFSRNVSGMKQNLLAVGDANNNQIRLLNLATCE